jgi:N-acetylglucosamine kinase-like BadF-type ATPase
MTEYVIGVDIGGTKSHLALFDSTGSLVDFAHWGPLNHEGLPGSFAQFEDELGQFVSGIVSKNGITMKQISYAVLGIAGNDTRKQHAIISEILKKIGFERFTLVNDAFLGIPAGSRTGIGICAINGTGCTLLGLNKAGDALQIGGVGYVSNDMGGGGNLARFAVSAVYSELFRKAEPTCMTPALLEYIGITDKHDFVERIYDMIEEKSFDRTNCIRILFHAAEKNDKVAMDFFRELAANYAGGISTMIDEMGFPKDEDLCIVLAGSVFVKGENPRLIDSLKEKLKELNPAHDFNYVILDVPPVAGAVIWALNTLNGKTGYYDKVCAEFQNVSL